MCKCAGKQMDQASSAHKLLQQSRKQQTCYEAQNWFDEHIAHESEPSEALHRVCPSLPDVEARSLITRKYCETHDDWITFPANPTDVPQLQRIKHLCAMLNLRSTHDLKNCIPEGLLVAKHEMLEHCYTATDRRGESSLPSCII